MKKLGVRSKNNVKEAEALIRSAIRELQVRNQSFKANIIEVIIRKWRRWKPDGNKTSRRVENRNLNLKNRNLEGN